MTMARMASKDLRRELAQYYGAGGILGRAHPKIFAPHDTTDDEYERFEIYSATRDHVGNLVALASLRGVGYTAASIEAAASNGQVRAMRLLLRRNKYVSSTSPRPSDLDREYWKYVASIIEYIVLASRSAARANQEQAARLCATWTLPIYNVTAHKRELLWESARSGATQVFAIAMREWLNPNWTAEENISGLFTAAEETNTAHRNAILKLINKYDCSVVPLRFISFSDNIDENHVIRIMCDAIYVDSRQPNIYDGTHQLV